MSDSWVYFDARDALRAYEAYPYDEWQYLLGGDLFIGRPGEWASWNGLAATVGTRYRRRRK